jgi:voltage-gated potassium channel
MWWAVATLTTVGYGDLYPVTLLGKAFASVIAVLGIGMFALPTGILGAGFVEAIQQKKASRGTCPHCGKEIR